MDNDRPMRYSALAAELLVTFVFINLYRGIGAIWAGLVAILIFSLLGPVVYVVLRSILGGGRTGGGPH